MPIYEYQCDSCGLRAEKLWKRVSLARDEIDCESCGSSMRKLMSAANHVFNHPTTQTRGMLPPSTGTSDDWNFDKAIGKDSEKKWEGIEGRNKIKDTVIRDERKAGRLVNRDHLVPKRDGSGDYRVITEPERVRANENREAALKISRATQKATQKKGPHLKKD